MLKKYKIFVTTTHGHQAQLEYTDYNDILRKESAKISVAQGKEAVISGTWRSCEWNGESAKARARLCSKTSGRYEGGIPRWMSTHCSWKSCLRRSRCCRDNWNLPRSRRDIFWRLRTWNKAKAVAETAYISFTVLSYELNSLPCRSRFSSVEILSAYNLHSSSGLLANEQLGKFPNLHCEHAWPNATNVHSASGWHWIHRGLVLLLN